jgi:hypothetical protein
MIKPTVGRIVWFYPGAFDNVLAQIGDQPFAAIITFVWSERMVNLTVFDHDGHPHAKTSVTLNQGDEHDVARFPRCEWMPYQKAVAADKIAPTRRAEPSSKLLDAQGVDGSQVTRGKTTAFDRQKFDEWLSRVICYNTRGIFGKTTTAFDLQNGS